MSADLISSVIDPVAQKQVDDLTASVKRLNDQFIDTVNGAIAVRNATSGSGTYSELNKNVTAAATAQTNLAKNTEQTRLAEIRLQQAREKSIDQYNKQNSAFATLDKQARQAVQNAKDIAAAQGLESAAAQEAIKSANLLQASREKIDASLGDFKNKVGGYANGIVEAGGKIFSIFRTIAYILPGIGIAGEFSLIGDAIIMVVKDMGLFVDKLTSAQAIFSTFNEVQKAANADIGKNQTIFKILSDTARDTSLSMQERIAAGKELIKQFPKELEGSTALKIANGEEDEQLKKLSASLIENAKARAALSKIQELQGKIQDAEFQKRKIQNAEANELAKSRKDEASGAFDQAGTGEAGGGGILAGDNEAKIHKRAVEATKLQDQNKKILQDQIDFLINYAGGEKKIAKVIETDDKKKDPAGTKATDNSDEEALRKQAENQKTIASNENLSYAERIKAAQNYYDLSEKLAELHNKKSSDQAKLSGSADDLEAQNRIAAQLETERLLKKIADDAEKDRLAQIKKNYDDLKALTEKYSEDEQLQLAKNYAEQANLLAKRYSEGLLNEKQYNTEKKKLDDTYKNVVADDQIHLYEDLRDLSIAFGGDGLAEQKKIDDLIIKQNKEKNDKLIADEELLGKELSDKQRKREQFAANFLKNAPKEAVDALGAIVSAGFEAQKQILDAQYAVIDAQTKLQIDAEERSLDSAKVKAEKEAVINAKAQAQKELIAHQERQLEHDKAIYEREVALARIAVQTAVNIVEGGINPFIIAAMIALGAIQAAAVLSTPIPPAFRHGGEMPYTGIAQFGEAGREFRIEPDGSTSLTPGSTTLGMVKKGTRFIDAETTTRILTRPDSMGYRDREQISLRELERLMGRVAKNTEPQRPVKSRSAQPQHWNTDYFRSKIN